MSYFNTMYGTDDVNTQLPVEMIATVNGFSRENQPIIELGKELIRCKDCIHHHGHDCENMNYLWTSDDFYCGWAEREEE